MRLELMDLDEANGIPIMLSLSALGFEGNRRARRDPEFDRDVTRVPFASGFGSHHIECNNSRNHKYRDKKSQEI